MRNWTYIFIAFAVIYAVRVLPLTLIRRPIRSRFLRSFLHYVPYVTLAVMTFPAIIRATDSLTAGIAALAVGAVVAWFNGSLITVAAACCAVVFLLEMFIR